MCIEQINKIAKEHKVKQKKYKTKWQSGVIIKEMMKNWLESNLFFNIDEIV